jgi:putative transposase
MPTSSYESLSHAKWDCKYHVVFILKGRKKALYGKIRCFLGPVLRALAGQRRSTILVEPMVQDHVHKLIWIPPTYAVASLASEKTLPEWGCPRNTQRGRSCRCLWTSYR